MQEDELDRLLRELRLLHRTERVLAEIEQIRRPPHGDRATQPCPIRTRLASGFRARRSRIHQKPDPTYPSRKARFPC